MSAEPTTKLRGCDTTMEAAVHLMVATMARGGCSHHMPEIGEHLGMSKIQMARVAALMTECADALRHGVNEKCPSTGATGNDHE